MIDLLKSKENEQESGKIKSIEDDIKALEVEIENKRKEIGKLFDDSSNAIRVFVDKQNK